MSNMIVKFVMDCCFVEIVGFVIEDMGFELVCLWFMGGKIYMLQIMVEKFEGGIEVDDCVQISNVISVVLDVEDLIEDGYVFEVGSSGIDCFLMCLKDFDIFEGYEVKVEISELIDGQRCFKGVFVGVEGEEVLINIEQGMVGLQFDWLFDVKFVLIDDLIKEMLC